jgi:chaperonin cofactor prefoldin
MYNFETNMNMRYLALTIVFILTSICSMAQNYIKFVAPAEINGRKFFKGEIYQQIDGKKILFGKDTIDLGEATIEKANSVDISKISDKSNFVINLDNINYEINVEEFKNNKDTIKLVKADNNIIPFFKNRTASIKITECGSSFRLIIPNFPSIVYYKSEIPKPGSKKTQIQLVDEPVEDDSFLSKITWWQYVFGGLFLLIVLYLFYKFVIPLFRKKKRQPIKKKFQGGKLSDFARNNNIDLYDLEKFNKSLLKGYSKMDDHERKKLQKNIEGEFLIVSYNTDESSNDDNIVRDFEHPDINNNFQQFHNTSELLSQMQQMESRILNKIGTLASIKEDSRKIENLQKEIESFKGKITLLNKDIEQGNQKINDVTSELIQVHKKNQELESEYLNYSEKVILVDYLEPYARVIYDYYNYCQTGYNKALEYFRKLNHSNSELISVVSQLLVKFDSNLPSKTNHWVGVINEIKDSKATANIDLIRSLKQIPNNEGKSKEFKRILLKEVFEKYASSIFILTEELSNLSKFTNDSTSFVNDFEQFFASFKSELLSKSKAIGLDLNYVPLFEHYEKYAAFTKLANQTCSLPYKNIKNISKDSVLEIINYGFGNEETNVILA